MQHIQFGYDQASRKREHLQEDIEWIIEATIPIEIEAANRSCAQLTKDLSAQASSPISVGIKWDSFVSIPEFVARGHDTVVGIMRNVYQVATNATAGIRLALTHELGLKAITNTITTVELTLNPKNISPEPILSLDGSVMGVSLGYLSTSKHGSILARRERVEDLLNVVVQVSISAKRRTYFIIHDATYLLQVHKALVDARYQAVVEGLCSSLNGRKVPVDVDWSVVDTPQFKALLPEEKSSVVESLHAGFPERVVSQG